MASLREGPARRQNQCRRSAKESGGTASRRSWVGAAWAWSHLSGLFEQAGFTGGTVIETAGRLRIVETKAVVRSGS
jgi:hypothetical protein